MIYLITGNMGTGKTSRVVNMILTNEDGLFKQKLEDGTEVDRPLYFCHIDGLDTKKFKAHELTEEQIQEKPLNEIVPQGSVLIVDECDYCYPVRAAGRPVPHYIQTLKELRHDGFTLILMTQHPGMIDVYLRNLVSKHIHLERKSLGMKQYWWYKCVTNLDNPAGVSGVESAAWKPPKAAFKYYKSSSQHQKFKKKIPMAVWALVGILVLVGWKSYGLYRSYSKAVNREPETTQAVAGEQNGQPQGLPDGGLTDAVGSGRQDNNLKPEDFVPTMAEKADYVKPNPEQYAVRRNITLLKQLNADLNGIKNRIKVAKDEFVRQILTKQQKEIKKHIKEVRQHLAEITEQTSAGQVAEKLESIPAIGQTTALILAHYLNMYRFDSENKFVAFAGLAPGKHESGSSVRRPDKLTKYGNRTIKGALYMPAMVAYRFGYFGAFVNRLKNKGKPPEVILIAIMRKLAAIAWNLWRNGQTFDLARYALNSKTA